MMKVLVVCAYKKGYAGNLAPFVKEQMDALTRKGLDCELFLVKGKGVMGYLGNLKALKKKIATFRPDVIHAHYGLSGLLANLQRRVPVVTTYHGSDINDKKIRRFSCIAMRLSAWNVFVSQKAVEIARPRKKHSLLPCGIDLTDWQLTGKTEARRRMGLLDENRVVLFSGAFDNPVKAPSLAKETVALLHDDKVKLLELKGYSREEMTLLMCAADVLLMTSESEGSPQVIKEAMACGCPIVSVDVGDVAERVDGVDGCYVAQTRDPEELAALLREALALEEKSKGRDRILADGLDNHQVVEQLIMIYQKVCAG